MASNIFVGTRTGQAIKYVADVLMTKRNGDRENYPNIVIVVTDGKSQDSVTIPSAALRKRQVMVCIVCGSMTLCHEVRLRITL